MTGEEEAGAKERVVGDYRALASSNGGNWVAAVGTVEEERGD